MEISSSQEQARVPITVLHMEDRINLGNVDLLIKKAREVFAQGARYLLLDLTDVPSITSAGLRALHAIYKLFDNGGDMPLNTAGEENHKSKFIKIVNPAPDVRRILNLVGYDHFIEIYDQRQDALMAY